PFLARLTVLGRAVVVPARPIGLRFAGVRLAGMRPVRARRPRVVGAPQHLRFGRLAVLAVALAEIPATTLALAGFTLGSRPLAMAAGMRPPAAFEASRTPDEDRLFLFLG